MRYSALIKQLISHDFQRIERDDRLLDILPGETREKGIELWEREEPNRLLLIRLRLPYTARKTTAYAIPRSLLEKSLLHNTPLLLANFRLSHLPSFLS